MMDSFLSTCLDHCEGRQELSNLMTVSPIMGSQTVQVLFEIQINPTNDIGYTYA